MARCGGSGRVLLQAAGQPGQQFVAIPPEATYVTIYAPVAGVVIEARWCQGASLQVPDSAWAQGGGVLVTKGAIPPQCQFLLLRTDVFPHTVYIGWS